MPNRKAERIDAVALRDAIDSGLQAHDAAEGSRHTNAATCAEIIRWSNKRQRTEREEEHGRTNDREQQEARTRSRSKRENSKKMVEQTTEKQTREQRACPPPSAPTAPGTRPAATALALPLLLPPVRGQAQPSHTPRSYRCRTADRTASCSARSSCCIRKERFQSPSCSAKQKSCLATSISFFFFLTAFPAMRNPFALSRATTTASFSAIRSRLIKLVPTLVRYPFTSLSSLIVTGMPSNSLSAFLDLIRSRDACASARKTLLFHLSKKTTKRLSLPQLFVQIDDGIQSASGLG